MDKVRGLRGTNRAPRTKRPNDSNRNGHTKLEWQFLSIWQCRTEELL